MALTAPYFSLCVCLSVCVCVCLCPSMLSRTHPVRSGTSQHLLLKKNQTKQKPALFIVLLALIFPAAPVGSSVPCTSRRSCLFPLAFTTDRMRAWSKSLVVKEREEHFRYSDWRNVLSDSLQEWKWEKLAEMLLAHFFIPFLVSPPGRRLSVILYFLDEFCKMTSCVRLCGNANACPRRFDINTRRDWQHPVFGFDSPYLLQSTGFYWMADVVRFRLCHCVTAAGYCSEC